MGFDNILFFILAFSLKEKKTEAKAAAVTEKEMVLVVEQLQRDSRGIFIPYLSVSQAKTPK